MERFVGKVSVVTGSGAGIGAAITKELVKRGLIVVGLSKIIEKESSDWSKNFPGKFYTIQCDVSVEEEIKNAFHTIKTTIGPISILVNNAGITSHSYLKDLSGEEIDNVFGTNVKGLLMAAKEAINSMEESPIDGHIVVICSTAAYRIPPLEESMVYAGSKHAARAISEALRLISVQKKSNIKISELSDELSQNFPGKFSGLQCDLSVEEDIQKTFDLIVTSIGAVSILINNAAVVGNSTFENIDGACLDNVYNTNVKGLILASKEAMKSMNTNRAGGHIVNICSIIGIKVSPWEEYFVYSGSKHAVKSFSESLRLMIVNKKLNIKISNLSPGLVLTEMPKQNDDLPETLFKNRETCLLVEDVANACIAVLDTPPNVLISELTVLPIHSMI